MQWGEWHGESVGYRRRDRIGPGDSSGGNRDRGVPDGLVDDRRFPWRRRPFATRGSRSGSARGTRRAVPRSAGSSLSRAAAASLSRAATAPLPWAAAASVPRAAGSLPRRAAGSGSLPARRPVSPNRCGVNLSASAVHDVGVMAEVHPGREQGSDAPDRGLPGRPVGGLAGWQLLVHRSGVLARRVGRVPDQQVG